LYEPNPTKFREDHRKFQWVMLNPDGNYHWKSSIGLCRVLEGHGPVAGEARHSPAADQAPRARRAGSRPGRPQRAWGGGGACVMLLRLKPETPDRPFLRADGVAAWPMSRIAASAHFNDSASGGSALPGGGPRGSPGAPAAIRARHPEGAVR